MDDELLDLLERRRKRRYVLLARPVPPGTQTVVPPPLDSLPATIGGYSFRKLATAYAGMCMNVKRASDSATQDIGFDGSGNFDTTGYNTFIGVSTGSVNIWYDQSGNANNLIPVGVSPINLTGLNGAPTIVFSGGTQSLYRATPPQGLQPLTDSAVAMRTGAFTAVGGLFGDQHPEGTGLYFSGTANSALIYAGTLSANVACADNVAHSLIGVLNGASSSLTVDGATTSGLNVGTNAWSGIEAGNVGGGPLVANVSEGLRWGSALSAANITALAANQKAYWHTP